MARQPLLGGLPSAPGGVLKETNETISNASLLALIADKVEKPSPAFEGLSNEVDTTRGSTASTDSIQAVHLSGFRYFVFYSTQTANYSFVCDYDPKTQTITKYADEPRSEDADYTDIMKFNDEYVYVSIRNDGATDRPQLLIFNISGTTVSLGANVQIADVAMLNGTQLTRIDATRVLYTFWNASNLRLQCCVLTVNASDPTDVTIGTIYDIYTSRGYFPACELIDTDKVAVFYKDDTTGKLFANVLDISGTVVTVNTQQDLTVLVSNDLETYLVGTDKVFVAYRYSGIDIAVATISGNTISLSTPQTISDSPGTAYYSHMAKIRDGEYWLSFTDVGNDVSYIRPFTESGGVFTFGTSIVTANTGTSVDMRVFDFIDDYLILTGMDVTDDQKDVVYQDTADVNATGYCLFGEQADGDGLNKVVYFEL